jgi:hypothetical protein
MIDGVFAEAKRHGLKNRDRDHKAMQLLLEFIPEQEQRASIVTQYFMSEKGAVDADDFLTEKLRPVLYEDNGWSQGLLLTNVVRLAIRAALLMKSVTIITTNYDTYIEDEFIEIYDEVVRRSAEQGGGHLIPGLERMVSPRLPSSDAWKTKRVREPQHTSAMVKVVYVHGRVSKTEATEGTIAFDERSYARGHDAVVALLSDHISSRPLLLLGASLTDGPLVTALARTASDAKHPRFALLRPSLPDTSRLDLTYTSGGKNGKLEEDDLQRILAVRGEHLGVQVLHPLSHSQTAQFVHELGIALRLQQRKARPMKYKNSDATYERRLQRWAELWQADHLSATDAYKSLSIALRDSVAPTLPSHIGDNDALRLEIWARMWPGSGRRALTLFANSVGPFLVDETLLRTEEVSTNSSNASVRTFLQGRPMLHTLSQLRGDPPRPSRWASFFSVPIYVQVEATKAGPGVSGRIPVGVITLAGLDTARLSERVSEHMTLPDIEKLKGALLKEGRRILKPRI